VPWFNVDDGFAFHRKAVLAGNAAIGLWTRAGSWCSRELTDGFVPDHMVPTMGTTKQAERLVRAGLWVRDDVRGGFQFHEFTQDGRNSSRETVLKKREQAAEKKRRQRERNDPKSQEPQVGDVCPGGTDGGVPGGVPGGVNVPTPLPSLTTTTNSPSESSPRRRATRIPDDFAVTPDMVEWARQRRPDVDGRLETEKFVNYWGAKSGKDATKTDWVKTWRNWILNAKASPGYTRPAVTQGTGSKRVDKALGFLSADDPLRESYGIALPPSDLRVLEGGKTA
jgi:hypothetical protein